MAGAARGGVRGAARCAVLLLALAVTNAAFTGVRLACPQIPAAAAIRAILEGRIRRAARADPQPVHVPAVVAASVVQAPLRADNGSQYPVRRLHFVPEGVAGSGPLATGGPSIQLAADAAPHCDPPAPLLF